MKISFLAVVGVIALAGCVDSGVESGSAAEMGQEEAFRTRVLGNNLVSEQGNVIYQADGTFAGTSGGQILEGRWQFLNGRYCVEGSVGGNNFPANCQNLIFDGNEVTFDGRDFDITYTIQS